MGIEQKSNANDQVKELVSACTAALFKACEENQQKVASVKGALTNITRDPLMKIIRGPSNAGDW
jgi:hypothetical protein